MQTDFLRTMNDLFPSYKKVKEALMSLLHFSGGEMTAWETYAPLADYFELSDRARTITRGEHYGSKPQLYGRRPGIQFGLSPKPVVLR